MSEKNKKENTALKDEKIQIIYIGKNPSYTAAGIRFTKTNKTAVVNRESAERLIKSGSFIEALDQEDI